MLGSAVMIQDFLQVGVYGGGKLLLEGGESLADDKK